MFWTFQKSTTHLWKVNDRGSITGFSEGSDAEWGPIFITVSYVVVFIHHGQLLWVLRLETVVCERQRALRQPGSSLPPGLLEGSQKEPETAAFSPSAVWITEGGWKPNCLQSSQAPVLSIIFISAAVRWHFVMFLKESILTLQRAPLKRA